MNPPKAGGAGGAINGKSRVFRALLKPLQRGFRCNNRAPRAHFYQNATPSTQKQLQKQQKTHECKEVPAKPMQAPQSLVLQKTHAFYRFSRAKKKKTHAFYDYLQEERPRRRVKSCFVSQGEAFVLVMQGIPTAQTGQVTDVWPGPDQSQLFFPHHHLCHELIYTTEF